MLSMLGGNSVFIILKCSEILTSMIGFSRESENQQKKRDDLSHILHASCSHDDAITKFVVYFSDSISGTWSITTELANSQ